MAGDDLGEDVRELFFPLHSDQCHRWDGSRRDL